MTMGVVLEGVSHVRGSRRAFYVVRTASAKIQKPETELCWKNRKKKKKKRPY